MSSIRVGLVVLALCSGCADKDAAARNAVVKAQLKASDEALATGDFVRASAAADLAAQYDPLSIAARDRLLRCALYTAAASGQVLNAEQFARADYQSEVMESRDPEYAHVYLTLRGEAALSRNEVVAAEQQLNAAIARKDDFAPAHLALANVFYNAKKLDEAGQEFERVTRLDPRNFGALALAGRIQLELNNFVWADELLQRAMAMNETAAVRVGLAQSKMRQQKPDEALVHLSRATVLEPKNAELKLRLGELLLSQGKLPEAEVALRESIQLGGGGIPLRTLGLLLMRKQDFNAGLQAFSATLTLLPDDPTSLFATAQAYEGMKRKPEAIAAYQRFVNVAVHRTDQSDRLDEAQGHLSTLINSK